ncbi:3-isopropylmalate dehydrogenase [Candidatus Gottesmanbacteria bacterium]|nr:3-isopropylmalate dehydrogenase [Candidatus Gottesmanbacteria bacterium]
MKKTIAVLPGDGVGPEIIDQAVKVLQKVAKIYHHEFSFEYGLIGTTAIEKTGNPLPDQTLKLCKDSDAILFGAIGDQKYDNDPSAKIRPEQGLLELRKSLALFVNIRPIFVFPTLINSSPLKAEVVKDSDFIVIRELTGGIYFGKPRMRKNHGKTAIDTSIYSESEIERIARVAFEISRKRNKNVVSIDKANVLETSRLWRETVTKTGKEYPDVELSHMFVDTASMQIIKNPQQFDVILTENMFGDILTDEASVISGSIGLLPSASIGERHALYEPIHGAYNKAAGKNTANPIAAILSVEMMLKYSFHLVKEWKCIWNAVVKTLEEGWRTKDLVAKETEKEKVIGTKEMGDKITNNI